MHYIRVIHSKVKDKNIGKNHANPRCKKRKLRVLILGYREELKFRDKIINTSKIHA